jgi:hypothetical protein
MNHIKVDANNVRGIREWYDKVNQLKIYRAKGYCELCYKYFGKHNSLIKGHHIIKPSKCKKIEQINADDNIVICCDECYKNQVLKSEAG